MAHLILSDQLTIRRLILYEVTLGKPVFNGYKDLCTAIGNPEYDYEEYDFWYHRFLAQNLDLEYDRSLDPVKPTFSDMPNEILVKVMEKLDVKSRLETQKVCHRFRQLHQKSECLCDSIVLHFGAVRAKVEIDDESFTFSNGSLTIERDGTTMGMQIAQDYEPVVKKLMNNVISHGKLLIRKLSVFSQDYLFHKESKLLFNHLLLYRSLKVKTLIVELDTIRSLVQLLLKMEPLLLEKLKVVCSDARGRDAVLDVFETEQFKQLKEVDLREFTMLQSIDIHKFSNFHKFNINVDSITPQEIVSLRDTLAISADFDCCEISCYEGELDLVEISRELGEGELGLGVLKVVQRWPIPNFEGYLKIEVDTIQIRITRQLPGQGEFDDDNDSFSDLENADLGDFVNV